MLNAIVDASLRYKVLVLVAFAVLIGLGVMAYRQVPVDAFPDVTPAQVNIYTESPGVAAEDIERLLTVPIEAAMAGLADVEVVLMTLLGGMGTVFGPVVGAATIVTLQNELADKVGSLVTVIMGSIFVICVLAFRRGIVGELVALYRKMTGLR